MANASRDQFKAVLKSQLQSEKTETVKKKSVKKSQTEKLAPHLMVVAGPGCGKTTTVVSGIARLCNAAPKIKVPSEQQIAIWDVMSQEIPNQIRVCAFSKAIEVELSKRLTYANVETRTCHGFGNSFLRDKSLSPETKYSKMEPRKTINLLEKVTGLEYGQLREKKIPISQIEELVRLSKMEMLGIDPDENLFELMEEIVSRHDIEAGMYHSIMLEMAAQVLKASKEFEKHSTYKNWFMPEFDFADMIWLPLALNLEIPKVDLIVVDEAQDLNRCQQELCLRMADRMVLVGDPRQAIFAFAGADSESMTRMEERLRATDRGMNVLPLSITYRCGKKIVEHCCELFPGMLQAGPDNPDGKISEINDTDLVKTLDATNEVTQHLKDMVVCRVNAPLVSVFFKCLEFKKKARIQGRDIGQGLIRLIDRLKASTVPDLEAKLTDWHTKETNKLMAKKFVSEGAIINLNDKYSCLMMFCKNGNTVEEIRAAISNIFTDSGTGILLTSMHRSKGLEADRVFILKPEKCPHPMAKTPEAQRQEIHLQWVARSRAINTLVYVKTTESSVRKEEFDI